jgi:hypothetical protein
MDPPAIQQRQEVTPKVGAITRVMGPNETKISHRANYKWRS